MKKYIFLLLLALGQTAVFAEIRPLEPDTNGVATGKASVSALPDLIRVENKTICYGVKGEKIDAIVSLPDTNYTIKWADSSLTVEQKLLPAGKNEAVIGDFAVGTYSLWALLYRGNTFMTLTNFTLIVGNGPVARILDKNRCFSPGEAFILTAEASENCDYAWSYSELLRTSLKKLTVDGVMGDRNQQYIFTVTDRNGGCVARDTAIVSPGPAAPQVSIDTNTNRLDIKIHWNKVSGATEYRVMSRLWDGYAVIDNYTEKALFADTVFTLASSQMDTLEFFYVQAKNNQCYSLSSDTVGYMQQTLYSVPDTTFNNMNYISYPFDMSLKGIRTNFDLGEYLGADNSEEMIAYSVSNFVFNNQVWEPAVYIKPLKKWIGEEINLVPGCVYRVALNRNVNKVDLLTYGKLLPKFSYNLYKKSETTSSVNFFMAPLAFVKDNKRQLIGNSIPNIANIAMFNFSKQFFSVAVFVRSYQRWTPTVEKDNVTVKVWSPLRVVVVEDVLNWTK